MEFLDIETSKLIVLQGEKDNSFKHVWAVFDVSPNTTQRFIAYHWEAGHPNESEWQHGAIVLFQDVHELLVWAVIRVEEDAQFRGGLKQKDYQGVEYLDKLAQSYYGLDYFYDVCKAAGVDTGLCKGCHGTPCLPCRR